MSKAFVEKYRPKNLDEMIGNPEIIEILKSFDSIPNLLFYGPPGTGKTSAVKILAKGYTLLELNASDERGIDIVRNQIKEFSSVAGKRLVILDEVDSMSRDAQNALRRIIEDTNTRFCLICNYVNKIITPIQSRCTKFRFPPIKEDEMIRRITYVCEMENINVLSGIPELVKLSDGDMRSVLNDLEGIWRGFGAVTLDNVYKFTGATKIIFDPKRMNEILEKSKGVIDGITICQQLGEEIRKSDLENKFDKLRRLAEIEYNLALGCSDEIQINGIKSIFSYWC